MTPSATDIYGTAFKNGSVTLMARVLGNAGAPVHQADLAAVEYSIYFLDPQDADFRGPVSGHQDVSLSPADVLYDTLQTGAPWDATADPAGYNFLHTPDTSEQPAFPVAGQPYLVEYRLTPVAGQVILARFRINVV